jgi:hypothetical protein
MHGILSNVVWTFENLFAGLRLTLPVRVSRGSFHFSSDQALILLVVACGATLFDTYLLSAAGTRLMWYSWLVLEARCFLVLLLYYLVARIQRALDTLPAIAVTLFSVAAFLDLCFGLIFWIGDRFGIRSIGTDTANVRSVIVWAILMIWACAVIVRSVRLIYETRWLRTGLLSGLIITGSLAANLLAPPQFWYAPRPDAESRASRRVDTERTYYAQPALMSKALAQLAPTRRGVGELYFVGFAGTSTQDVFMKEVQSAQALFDERFDTRHRSLILVNNPRTVSELPVASVSNLQQALIGIAKRMNVQKDVLFLYLTSHGSSHLFSVSFPELALDGLSDRKLKSMLDRSGIKWRVVVISACYSGSFIEALKDDHTLIVTAAAEDRTSFGCASENDFTYFGDAYINTALRQDRSFISAFDRARDAVGAREQEEELTPSEPQIYVGKAMPAKLQELERRLAKLPIAAACAADAKDAIEPPC